MPNTEKKKIEQTVLAYCRQQRLFSAHNRVIAACSGGADSMALLLFLLNCGPALGIRVEAVHVNHGLRASAGRDEAFVQKFCREHGVFLHVFRLREETFCTRRDENWAREERYRRFAQCAGADGLVATAHTAADQAETLLLRLARGTGLHGAGGIAPVRDRYIRPFLCLSRAQTEEYCRLCGQTWVEDETNAGEGYARNRVRHQAMPALESVNGAAVRNLAQFCRRMRELDRYFSAKAEELLARAARAQGYDARILREADGPVLRAALHVLVGGTRDAQEKYVDLLEEMLRRQEGAVQLSPQVCWRLRGGILCCGEETQQPEVQARPFAEGVFEFPGGFCIKIGVEKNENFIKTGHIHKKDLNCVADYAKIQGDIWVRARKKGDSFCLPRRGCTKSLKKLYNEMKIPLSQRTCLPLIARGSEVLWLWGQGFAAGLQPDENTEYVVTVRQMDNKEEQS